MADLDTREWLLNGLGSFASGTVSDARTHLSRLADCSLDPPSSHAVRTWMPAWKWQLVVALTNFWGSGKVEPTGFKLLRV